MRICIAAWLIFLSSVASAEDVKNPRLGAPMPPAQEVWRTYDVKWVTALSFSHDGKRLYVGDNANNISVWDVETKRLLFRPVYFHEAPLVGVRRLELSQDDKTLVEVYGTMIIVEVADTNTIGRRHQCHFDPKRHIVDLAISPDASKLVVSTSESPVSVYDLNTGKLIKELKSTFAGAVCFYDAEHIVARVSNESGDYAHGVVALKDEKVKVRLLGVGERLKIDKTEKWLLSSGSRDFQIWSLDDLRKSMSDNSPTTITGVSRPCVNQLHEKAFTKISFDHWSLGKQQLVINPKLGVPWPDLPIEPGEIRVCDISSNGKYAAVAGFGETLRLWDLTLIPRATSWTLGSTIVYDLTCTQDGNVLAGTTAGQDMTAWNRVTSAPVAGYTIDRQQGYSPLWPANVFFKDNDNDLHTLMASHSASKDLMQPPLFLSIKNLKTGTKTKEVGVWYRETGVQSIFSRNGEFIILFSSAPASRLIKDPSKLDPKLRIMDPDELYETISALQVYDSQLNPLGKGCSAHLDVGVKKASLSPNGKLLISLSENGTMRIFETQTQKQLPFKLQIAEISDISVTDQGYLLTTSTYGSMSCFNIHRNEKVAENELAHARPIKKVAVNPSGTLAATISQHNMIKLWSMPDLKPKGFFEGSLCNHPDDYSDILFLDDQSLAAAVGEGVVNTWSIKDALDSNSWNVFTSASSDVSVTVSKDGNRIAVGDSGVIYLLNGADYQVLKLAAAHSDGIQKISFIGGSYDFETVGRNGQRKIWNLEKQATPIQSDPQPKHAVNFPNEDSTRITLPIKGFLKGYQIEAKAVCELPDRNEWVMIEKGLFILSKETQTLNWGFRIPSPVRNIVYNQARQELLTSHYDGVVRRWKLPSKK